MRKLCFLVFLSVLAATCLAASSACSQEALRITLKSRTSGTTSDPANNNSLILTVELLNQKAEPIRLDHRHFILQCESGRRFVSVKYRTRSRFYGDWGTPDVIVLQPSQAQEVNLTFNLPGQETPVSLLIQGRRGVSGRLELR